MRRLLITSVLLLVFMPGIGHAQLVTEIIQLEQGWNAVWFNVEPDPNELVDFLVSQAPPLDCQAIWTFEPNRDVTADPTSTPPGRWLFHDKGVPPSLHTLSTLQGHRAYLFKVNVGGPLRLTGRPVIRPFSFSGRVSNLFGAMSDSLVDSLTFEDFFAHPNAAGKVVSSGTPVMHDIFLLSQAGLVRRSLVDSIAPNAAYWINVVQDFAYAGPLNVASSANGISFGRSTAIRTLSIDVPSSPASRTVSLQAHPCIDLGGEACGQTAAGVEWLEYRDSNGSPLPTWRPLSAGLDISVPAGTTKINLDLRAKRATLSALSRGTSGEGSATLPPLFIDISDDQGSRTVIAASVSTEPIFGRWIGRAELTRVNTHPIIQSLALEQAAASPLQMTLLLDLPSPEATAGGAAPRLLDSVTISSFRDGKPLQRRFSSVLFDRPVNLVEDGADPLDAFGAAGTLQGTLHILPEDALNPFRHRYNPEHRAGYDIIRQITIKLEPQAATFADELAGLDGTFGPSRLTGQYTEVITGLTHDPITVQGTFRLERLAEDSVSTGE